MTLNHVLLLASDMNEMSQFLISTLGLTPGPRPEFGFAGVWLYDDNQLPCIHIVSRAEVNHNQGAYLQHKTDKGAELAMPVVDHLAFLAKDLAGVKAKFHKLALPFVERSIPQADEHQLFVTGPDGLKLELLFSETLQQHSQS